ncbi:MAG TPA: M28 family peptidase [Pirellulales bacterium]|nr:M28 family peptidase [Pirellulales bacterium]
MAVEKAPPPKPPRKWRRRLKITLIIVVVLGLGGAVAWRAMFWMPGESFAGPLPPLAPEAGTLAEELRRDVVRLAGDIGERNLRRYPQLIKAARHIESQLRSAGYDVSRQVYEVVAFTNEEPPYFQRPTMGSWAYAHRSRERDENLVCVLSLETLGYYSDDAESQRYPPPLGMVYPSVGNFVGVVGNVGSRPLVHRVLTSLRQNMKFPTEAGAVPNVVPGVGWSDHWSFWQEGYQAVMITDTAVFRNPNYHRAGDTPDTLDYERMARVVEGIEHVIREVAAGKW